MGNGTKETNLDEVNAQLLEFKSKLLHLCEQYKMNMTGVFHHAPSSQQMVAHVWEIGVSKELALNAFVKIIAKANQESLDILNIDKPFLRYELEKETTKRDTIK